MHSSFLFGTIHIARAEVVNPIVHLTPYLQECTRLALELDLDDMAGMVALATPIWSDLISAKRLAKLDRIFRKAYGIRLKSLTRVPPIMIMQKITECILKPTAMTSVDNRLWEMADELGMDKSGLETLEEQMGLMHKIKLADQVQMLTKAARHIKANRRHHKKLLMAYLQQDIQYLYQSSKSQMGSYKKEMIYYRNFRMANRLADLHAQAPTFAGVGAAHLDGKFGCLAELKMLGLKVEPLPHWKE